MTLPTVEIQTPQEQIFSPYSGLPSDGENGPRENDETLLFVHYGDAGDSGLYISERLIKLLNGDIDNISIEKIESTITLEGAFVLKIDAGWNGINSYGFAPSV